MASPLVISERLIAGLSLTTNIVSISFTLLEFRVHLAMLHQRPRSDRAVRIGRRQSEKAFEHGSCCGGPLRWSGATDRSRFTACCGHEAERLAIAEPPCERILDQARRQRRCLAPTTRPDQCEGRWLGL